MDGLPQELLFALVFGAVLLAQFLFERLRLRKRGPLSETESASQGEPETEEWGEPDTGAPEPRAVEVPQPVQVVHPVPVRAVVAAPPRAVPAPARRTARRFSRRALMGNRRAVQDAVVIAAILGPCRAYQPHDID